MFALIFTLMAQSGVPVVGPILHCDEYPPAYHHRCYDCVVCMVIDDPCCPKRPPRDPLTEPDIMAGMKTVEDQVRACVHEPMTFKVKVTANPDGTVQDAWTDPRIADTATDRCVQRAVRHAKFRTANYPTTFRFPYRF